MMTDATEANAELLAVGTEIATELAGKDSIFSKELINEIKPFAEALAKQVEDFQGELNAIKQKLKSMKKNNDLYLGDLNDFYNNSIQEFM
jgi:predicted nuclease with TOPRIM domain